VVPSSSEVRLALIGEAARKSRVCWLSYVYDGDSHVRDRLVWHGWHDGALVVLSGPAGGDAERATGGGPAPEQVLPGIERAATVEVTLRSRDTGGRLVSWSATVEVVTPGTEAWEAHASVLLGVRLNLADPAAARRAWAERGTVVRLAPPLP
jgi:hypothetical protein